MCVILGNLNKPCLLLHLWPLRLMYLHHLFQPQLLHLHRQRLFSPVRLQHAELQDGHMDTKKSRGVGDTVEKFTQRTGLKRLVEKVSKDCGCSQRRDKLNEMFPYKNQ